jgi:hypothetical protein
MKEEGHMGVPGWVWTGAGRLATVLTYAELAYEAFKMGADIRDWAFAGEGTAPRKIAGACGEAALSALIQEVRSGKNARPGNRALKFLSSLFDEFESID